MRENKREGVVREIKLRRSQEQSLRRGDYGIPTIHQYIDYLICINFQKIIPNFFAECQNLYHNLISGKKNLYRTGTKIRVSSV